jgi:dienelactone hydrolase
LRVLALLIASLVTGLTASTVSNATDLGVVRRTMDEQVALIRPFTETRVPSSAEGPVPTIIMFHGCGGLRDVQEAYARAALDHGYGVMIVDSNGARGIGRLAAMSQVCLGLRLWGQERAADVFASLVLAREDDRLDADRLALIGWSHGGWTVLEALSDVGLGEMPAALAIDSGASSALAGVRSAITFYPYCGFPVRSDGRSFARDIPLHAILAGRDVIAPPGACETIFERASATGFPVDYAIWPGLTHAFDEPNPPADPRIHFDADAAGRARDHLISILDRDLAPQG